MRRLPLLLALLPGLALAQTPHTPAGTGAAFVDMIGLNVLANPISADVEMLNGQTASGNPIGLGRPLGVRHVRSNGGIGGDTDANLALDAAHLALFAGASVKVDAIFQLCYCGRTYTAAMIASWVSKVLVPCILAGVCEMVEGPNEVDGGTFGDNYNGSDMSKPPGIKAFQQALYAAVQADPVARTVPVATFTMLDYNDPTPYVTAQPSADLAAYHSYGANIASAAATFAFNAAQPRLAPGVPNIITEVGWATGGGQYLQVGELAAARLDLNYLFDAFSAGATAPQRVDIYNLTQYGDDNYTGRSTSSTTYNSFFGAFKSNGWPKLLANALANVIGIFTSNSTGGGSVPTLTSLSLVGSGVPANMHAMLVQQSNNEWDEVLWVDAAEWDSNNSVDINAAPTNVTITFAGPQPSILVYDPIASPVPIAPPLLGASAVTVTLGGDPLIIQVGPASGGRLGSLAPANCKSILFRELRACG